MNGRALLILTLILFMLLPCLCAEAEAVSDTLYVKKVENLPEDL